MTDTPLNSAEKVLADVQAETAKLETDGKSEFVRVETYVKLHKVWLIGLACMVVGFGLGWVFHLV